MGSSLSPRQREIVVLVGRDGAHWKTVAADLGISLPTVLSHVRKAMSRCGVTNRKPREACTAIYYRHIIATDDARSDVA